MKARNHEMCSVRRIRMVRQATASKRQQKQAYRQYIFVSSIELSNQVPACHLVSRIGTVLESHKKPWTGSQAGDRSSMGASRSVGQLGPPGPPPHHDALEALRAVRCASCQPPGNLLAGEIQRLDSEAATPMDPDLLHASRMHQM
jgi:hypothetical protein